jgi:hypothetical protein
MKVSEYIEILKTQDPDADVQVQVCEYDGNSETYFYQCPLTMITHEGIVVLGMRQYYGKLDVCKWFTSLSKQEGAKIARNYRDYVIDVRSED